MSGVRLASRAGMCTGVRRAVALALAAASSAEGTVWSLGPLAHNEDVLSELADAGIRIAMTVDEASPGDTVVIRAHGISPSIRVAASARGLQVVDATCPVVTRLQEAAVGLAAEGYQVVIVGDGTHPEVVALMGHVPGALVIGGIDGEGSGKDPGGRAVAVVAQTTVPKGVVDAVVAALRARWGEVRVERTTCADSVARQEEARWLARAVDLMIVIGGRNSANTARLVEVCEAAGTPVRLVGGAADIEPDWLKGRRSIGVTAGASTPDRTIKEVVARMEELKQGDPSEENVERVEPDEKVEADEATVEAAAEECVEAAAEECVEAAAEEETVEAAAEECVEAAAEECVEAAAEECVEAAAEEETVEAAAEECVQAQAEAGGESGAEAVAESIETDTGEAAEPVVADTEAPSIEAPAPEIRTLRPGDIIRGTVVAVGQDNVLVDVGHKSEGVIPTWELSLNDISSPEEVVAVGDEIDVCVLAVEGAEGVLRLSKKRADEEIVWQRLEAAYESGEVLEAPVTEEVKGGLIVDVGSRGFMPASHVERGYVSDLSQYVGKTARVRVIEIDRPKNRVILSQKSVLEEEYQEKREETWSTISEGERRHGIVKSITDFGAFVDVGGVDGLLHVSEMSWGRVNHPSEVVSEGDEIEVMVLRLDREKEKISLGLKQALPDPWDEVETTYPADSVVTGKVVRVVGFGAFVQLQPGVEGLVHISQLANRRVVSPEEVVSVGEEVRAKVLRVSAKDRRISLSMKEVEQEREQAVMREYMSEGRSDNLTLGDVFGDILSESRERIGSEDENDVPEEE